MVLVMFYSIPPLIPSCHSATNLAKGKPYTVYPIQNYSLSAPPNNTTALTDGSYTVGYYWTQKTTVGWRNAKTVEILIDLGNISDIGSLVFNTARGREAGVYYPTHVAAFVGADRDHLSYVGDLVDDPGNIPGSYQVKKFRLNDLGVRGRYVFLVAIPKGVFVFCDEVEVIEGDHGQPKAGSLTVAQARIYVEQISRLDGDKFFFSKIADNLATMITDPTEEGRLREIRQKIKSLQISRNADPVEAELLSLRRSVLYRKFSTVPLHVQVVDPWASLNPVFPVSVSSEASLSLVSPKGGYDSRAVLVTNMLASPAQVAIGLDRTPAGFDLSIFQVPFIKTTAMEQVADPLVPAQGVFKLRSGESRIVFITVHGIKQGKWKNILHIKCGEKVTSLPIEIQVANVELPNRLLLNAVNWGYMGFNLIKDRKQTAVDDLLAHHTDVVVVPSTVLPLDLDLSQLEPYLRLHRGFSKVIFLMSLRSDYRLMLGGRYPFLGEQWKTAMAKWYMDARNIAVQSGFKADQVYWFPFDEMKGKEIDQFIALAQWARKKIPGVKFYATLDSMDAERALPYLDVAQIFNDDGVLAKLNNGKTEKWIYDTKAPAKSLSPYSYYRMMSWKAFLNGYTGIGFWAYADAGFGANLGSAWDDFDGQYPDYAVIYEGEGNSIISSRRWEAWRMGIEDFEILSLYAKAKGDVAAKALAKSVFDDPQDTSKADVARRRMLLELSR